jgi:hypothetical protein
MNGLFFKTSADLEYFFQSNVECNYLVPQLVTYCQNSEGVWGWNVQNHNYVTKGI